MKQIKNSDNLQIKILTGRAEFQKYQNRSINRDKLNGTTP
jgi:hypothetical protein